MDSQTRQIYFSFLAFLADVDLDQVNEEVLGELLESVEKQLAGTELQSEAKQRISNAIRFVESAENGSATYELRSLVSNVQRMLDND